VNVVVFGATGMVGKGVLLECLDDGRVDQVLVVSRRPIEISHPKLREIVHDQSTRS
jgi:NAD dependent epimerase/dehydratase family enzyme